MRSAATYLVRPIGDEESVSRLQQYAHEKGYKTFEEIYVDEGAGGYREFERLLHEAREREIKAVVIRDLGQLGPSQGLLMEALLRVFESGLEIISYAEGLNSSTSEGKAILLRLIANVESKLTPMPPASGEGRKSKPGRRAVEFNIEEGIKQRLIQHMSYSQIAASQRVSKGVAHCRTMRGILIRLKSILMDQEPKDDHQAGEDGNGQGGAKCGAQGGQAEDDVGEEAPKVPAGDDRPGQVKEEA